MTLVIKPPYPPMEAKPVDEIPAGSEWQYEPKWDGFRCVAFREGENVFLQSKSCQPLQRYFPELVESIRRLPAKKLVLDGEIVVPVAGRLSFDELLMRIHPAESRVRKLASEHPAMFVVFDMLADSRGRSLATKPLAERRKRLERLARTSFGNNQAIRLSPATRSLSLAKKWFAGKGANLDGVIAKRLELPYLSGDRSGMCKVKHRRTADCVVGGFRYAEGKKVVGSLLLGLYEDGLLDHVGFTSSFTAQERQRMTSLVEPLIAQPGFTGRSPGGPSRWSTKRSAQWEPLRAKLVVEVQYDHFTGGRFRHGTKLLRWRPDKSAKSCTFDQVEQRGATELKLLMREGRTGEASRTVRI